MREAFGTILDSNITTLIAGIALLISDLAGARFCRGALSWDSDLPVLRRRRVTRADQPDHGRRRKVESLAIGQVWKPAGCGQRVPPANGHVRRCRFPPSHCGTMRMEIGPTFAT